MTQDYIQYPTFSGAAVVAQNVTPTSITNSPGGVYLSKGFRTPVSWRNSGSRNYILHKYGAPSSGNTYSFAIEGRNSPDAAWGTVAIQGPVSLALTESSDGSTFNGGTIYTIPSTVGVPAEVRFRLNSMAAGTTNYVGVDYDYTPPTLTGGQQSRGWQKIRVWQPRGTKPTPRVPIIVSFLNSGFDQGNPSGYTDTAGAIPADTKIVAATAGTIAEYALARGWVYAEAVLTGKTSNTVISGNPADVTAVRPFGTEDDLGIGDNGLWRLEDSAEYTNADNPKAQKDARWVVQWVRAYAEELGVDPNWIIAYGNSGGGASVLWAGNGETQDVDSPDLVLRQSSIPNVFIPYRSPFWFPVYADALGSNPFPSGSGTFGTTTTASDEINLSAVKYLFDTPAKRRALSRRPFLLLQAVDAVGSHLVNIGAASNDQFALPAVATAQAAFNNPHLFWQSAVFWRMLVADLNNWAVSNTGVDPLLGHFHGSVSKFRSDAVTADYDDLPANTKRYFTADNFPATLGVAAEIGAFLDTLYPPPVGYSAPGTSSVMSLYLS